MGRPICSHRMAVTTPSNGDRRSRATADTTTSNTRFNPRVRLGSSTRNRSFIGGTYIPHQHISGRSQFFDTEVFQPRVMADLPQLRDGLVVHRASPVGI